FHEAPQTQLGWCVDDDHEVEGLGLPDLDEERDVVHDDGAVVRRPRLRVTFGGEAAHLGVHDRVEAFPGVVVGEHEAGERGAVERAVRGEHTRAELRDDRVEPDRAGRDCLTREQVVVDDDGAQLAEASQGDRLARGDPTREPDAQHASILPDRGTRRAPGQSGSLGSSGVWWSKSRTPRRQEPWTSTEAAGRASSRRNQRRTGTSVVASPPAHTKVSASISSSRTARSRTSEVPGAASPRASHCSSAPGRSPSRYDSSPGPWTSTRTVTATSGPSISSQRATEGSAVSSASSTARA